MVRHAGERSLLGVGLYTPQQAAYLARVTPRTLARWLHGDDRGQPALRAQLRGDTQRRVTFLDLVQVMAVRAILRERAITLAKIRDFMDHAQREYGLTYPFARRHTTYLFDDDIVVRHGERIIQVTGRYKDQDLIRPVAELYMEDLSFQDDLASAYTPLRAGDRYILVSPHHRMGQPLVMPCGYSVEALLASVRAEGTPEAAAAVNAVTVADVRLAQRYEDILAGVAA